jgi:hypothetical protein
MKTKSFNYVFLLALVAVFLSACQDGGKFVTITNETSRMRVEEPVIILRADLESAYGKLPVDKFPVLTTPEGDIVPVQHDDLTGDGLWDEMFMLITQPPESAISYSLLFVEPGELPVFEARTNVRFARIQDGEYIPLISGNRLSKEEGLAGGVFQMEGPAWENERVGFRNYFDVRNGMDIFGKITTDMVLDRVGINEDYHFKQDWGQDILRVGTSLGAGSLALEIDGELHRVAPEADGTYELITQGPLRSTLRFAFNNWVINGQTYSLVHEIDIFGGAWYYQSRVFLEANPGNATLVAGITSIDLAEKKALELQNSSVITIATHGPQAYDYEQLGMAIMLNQNTYVGYDHTDDQSGMPNTFIVRMNPIGNEPVSFRYYACWDYSEPRFSDADYFTEFLNYEGMKMAAPLVVALK